MSKWQPFKRDDVSINLLLELAFGFERSRVLLTACELDIFSIIGAGQKTSDEVASELDTNSNATERLLNSLCAIKILKKTADKYSNTTLALRFLDKSKPEYMGLFNYHNYLWNYWTKLTDSVRTGKPVEKKRLIQMKEEVAKSLIDALHWRSLLLAHDIVQMIELTHVNRILDLGGAMGEYAIEFLNAKPKIKPFVYVYPNVYPYTRDYIRREGYEGRIEVMSGDYYSDDIGSNYDMIFLSFVIHHRSIWDNINLCQRLYDSIRPGGYVCIQDYMVNDSRTEPEFNALLALEMLVSSEGGNAYSQTDFWVMLKEAWFKEIFFEDTGFGTTLITAKR